MKTIKTFRITEANLKRLASSANTRDRSEGYIINQALDYYLKFYHRAIKSISD